MLINIMSIIAYLLCMVLFPIYYGATIVLAQKHCSVCVDAICCGNSKLIIKCTTTYNPEFIYTFNDIQYKNYSSQPMEEPYCENKHYNIYINSKNPSEFITKKCTPIGGYIAIGIGVFFFILLFFIM